MKASKFLGTQKAFISKRGDEGVPVADFPEGRDQPGDIFNWRKKYAGLPLDVKRRLNR